MSFLPVIDAVLDLPVAKVQAELECCPLRSDFEDLARLRVGVVIRSGPRVSVENLTAKLVEDREQGALNLHCYLMILNGSNTATCDDFENVATGRGLEARALSVPLAEMNEAALRSRLRGVMHAMCH